MYLIIGKDMDTGESEVVDETESKSDAEYLRGEYQMAFGPTWKITVTWKKD